MSSIGNEMHRFRRKHQPEEEKKLKPSVDFDRQVYWTPVDKYGVIAQTTLEQLKSFAKDFLQRMYIQCLVQGNVSMEGALNICRRVADTLRCRPLKAKDFPTLAVCQASRSEGDSRRGSDLKLQQII